jgi:HPt (histidine-containing phosphotransfer) domain-containing protein
MDDYIAKPVELPTLLAKLEQWLPIPGERRGASAAGTPAASRGGEDDVLDTRALNELTGGDPEFRRQVLVEFARSFPGDVERMREAFEARDMTGVTRMAHRVKGVSTSVGAMRLAQACAELEAAGRDSQWDAIVATMRVFEEQAERLRVEIARLAAVDRDSVR